VSGRSGDAVGLPRTQHKFDVFGTVGVARTASLRFPEMTRGDDQVKFVRAGLQLIRS